jgi:hypothetical protein
LSRKIDVKCNCQNTFQSTRKGIRAAAKVPPLSERPYSRGDQRRAIQFDMRISSKSDMFAAEARMNTTRSNKEDLVFYVLSALATAWAVVCVVGLLMRAK